MPLLKTFLASTTQAVSQVVLAWHKDQAEAVKWYRKAAEQNYGSAQYHLGLCYHNGEAWRKMISKRRSGIAKLLNRVMPMLNSLWVAATPMAKA